MILPELVCNYSDMPIQRHDCENSVFLPAEQLCKTRGGVVWQRYRSYKLAAHMPKMNRVRAPLRFVCPNCTSPLPARLTRLAKIALNRVVNHHARSRSLATQNAINRLTCIINHRYDPRVIHMARAENANRSNDRPVIIAIRRNHQ